MPKPADNEQQTRTELIFALTQRDSPTLVFLECNSYTKRTEIADFLRKELTEYKFHDIDLTPIPTISLLRSLTENLPAEIVNSKPVEYVVNVYGLENSLIVSKDGQLKHSDLTAQLNLERELLFRNVPYIIIIWADHSFFKTLQREAPDLWSWVVYKFRFEGTEVVEPGEIIHDNLDRLPHIGDANINYKRIEELKEIYDKLNIDSSEKIRLLKDKINILILLSKEYLIARDIDAAEKSLLSAKQISEGIKEENFIIGSIYFYLADLYSLKQDYKKSLNWLEKCLKISTEWNYGDIYNLRGKVHYGMNDHTKAIDDFTKSIYYKRKVGSIFDLGDVYHNLGMVFTDIKDYNNAIIAYNSAINLKKSDKSLPTLGYTYHELGHLYETLNNLDEALKYLEYASEEHSRAHNYTSLAVTCQRIGVVYENKKDFSKALKYFKKSLELNHQYGNLYNNGRVYHHLGNVYKELKEYNKAEENYILALDWKSRTGNKQDLGITYQQLGLFYYITNNFIKAKQYYLLARENYIEFNTLSRIPEVDNMLTHVKNEYNS